MSNGKKKNQTSASHPLVKNVSTEEAKQLRQQLFSLRAFSIGKTPYHQEIERIFLRAMRLVDTEFLFLSQTVFPLPRKTHHLVRSLQDLLLALAEDISSIPDKNEYAHPLELRLWWVLCAFSRYLLICSLGAAPAVRGVWKKLHQCYLKLQTLNLAESMIEKRAALTPQSLYHSTLLLGCAQPNTLTAKEISFIAKYLEKFIETMDFDEEIQPDSPNVFWVDPSLDAPAFACSRRNPPPDAEIHYFSSRKLVQLICRQTELLESGTAPADIGLPEFAAQPSGRAVLRHLETYWSNPCKRHFPRRRQSCRADFCCGLDTLWHLFHRSPVLSPESSAWMVINESPNGYAVMHISGKPGVITVGDIAAIRTEKNKRWQVCIIRWALSENQEHLELGLQILSTCAIPATLFLPENHRERQQFPALVLPEIPHLRTQQTLVVSPGVLETTPTHFILLTEQNNLEIREVKNTRRYEQNSRIEIFSVEPQSLPG